MTAFPSQISKLIPRLASEHDGEVTSTARAIERLLRSVGLDWFDIAKLVEAPDPIVSAYNCRPAPQRPPAPAPTKPPSKPRKPGWSDFRRSEQMALCAALLERGDLDEKARALVADVSAKLHIGQNFYLAPRQKRILTGLVRTNAEGLAA